MAKHNHVIINGQVAQNPTIIRDENGVPERGIVAIKTIRGIRDFGNNIDNLRYDMPIVMTGAPELVKKMSKWREGDMVEVKGSLTTRDITRNMANTMAVTIEPTERLQRELPQTRKRAKKLKEVTSRDDH